MPEQRTTLRDMIQDVLNSGVTYRELEDRARRSPGGETISRGTFNKIALGKLDRMPLENHLRAIAAGLRAPYESVRQAAIAQWLPEPGATEANEDAERQEMIRELHELKAKADQVLARLDELDEPNGGELKSA